MRPGLERWVRAADAREQATALRLSAQVDSAQYLEGREGDLYFALVGEFFDRLRDPGGNDDWSQLANALAQVSRQLGPAAEQDAKLFAAAAFFQGGYSASAYITMRTTNPQTWESQTYRACYDLIARPRGALSSDVRALIGAVRRGDLEAVSQVAQSAVEAEQHALLIGPDEWVAAHLFSSLVERFVGTNIRAVLPRGYSEHWNPLVESLLNRRPPVWDFFPSQIRAIEAGLLTSDESFALQMPTGAGKTALTESLLFSHLAADDDAFAVLLVPYRSLARELRHGLARRLTTMGFPTRAFYGGTVASREEVRDLEGLRAAVATPESLLSIFSAAPELAARVSLAVCDEGHLLDSGARGVSLELLLARMRRRAGTQPRFVFVSAIVPNIEEINAWLGGSSGSVVRTDFRPATAEFGVLRPSGTGISASIALQMHPEAAAGRSYLLPAFLMAADFKYYKAATKRTNTYRFDSVKTQAVAAARKALPLGSVALFAATKTGDQGAVGLARELLNQLDHELPMPHPLEFVEDSARLPSAAEYLEREYGRDWVGTQVLRVGAMLHHGDIPQESREVLEKLLIDGLVRVVICTNTLAEGVNLPIRTLVLYSVRRRSATGASTSMLARDIKNLVGRAGRAGASTRGLVICANPNQWSDVHPVAVQQPGERVGGALLELVQRLQAGLSRLALTLTNEILENEVRLFSLVDGIDSTLIELASEEIGDTEFLGLARSLASETFAARQGDAATQQLLENVFELRARRIVEIRGSGRLGWVRDTGTRLRLLDSVVNDLASRRERWDEFDSPLDPGLLAALLGWSIGLPEVRADLVEAYRGEVPNEDALLRVTRAWLDGRTLAEMATVAELDIDSMLRVHAKVLSHALLVAIEQGVGLLTRHLSGLGETVAQAVLDLPGHLRFGVPTMAGRVLAAGGVRHRRAAVLLGAEVPVPHSLDAEALLFTDARRLLLDDPERWRRLLGALMYDNTVQDLTDPSQDEGDADAGGETGRGT